MTRTFSAGNAVLALGWLGPVAACHGPDSVAALASRCADCHTVEAAALQASRHGRAGVGELYVALREHLGEPACDGCHLPDAEADGLSCATCHAAIGNERTSDGRLVHAFAAPVQAARTNHNAAHLVQAGFPGDASLCGTCHESTSIPAFHETPFSNWQAGPAAASGVRCQDCHQRDVPGESDADGADRHAWIGLAGEPMDAVALLRRATELTVRREDSGAWVTLRHLVGGHSLPDGASFLRRLAVEVDGALPAADALLSATWTARGVVVEDPASADGNLGHALPPEGRRSWWVAGSGPVRACLVFAQERPELRRILGLPVEAAREAVREVWCATG